MTKCTITRKPNALKKSTLKQKEPVDVATLEKSTAKSEVATESPGPVAAGQAGG